MLHIFTNLLRGFFKFRKPKQYGYHIVQFKLPADGIIDFAQWEHPKEVAVNIDQSIVDFYRKYIPQGSFAIDIGTHIGDTTVPMALAAGKNGLVLGLEPNPFVFKILEANANLNTDRTNIVALNFAATAEDGSYVFASGDSSFNNGGIIGFSNNAFRNTRYSFQVTGKNIENYLKKEYAHWLDKFSLMKIDAEGYDKEILRNMSSIISKCKPVIITECFRHLKASERFELFDSIANHGYTLYHKDGFDDEKRSNEISRDDMLATKHFDILALPRKNLDA